MSKLRPYLAEIASAIREKKGTSDKINAQNFAEEIRSIEGGGGSEPTIELERKDVNFYDYDGTLLYAYTLEEAHALTELPPAPTHEGLVFQEWNWDYEDVIALDYPMDIGALYITDDGKTRLYFEGLNDKVEMTMTLYFSQSAERGVEVDWGDGSPIETFDGTTVVANHSIKGYTKLRVSLNPINATLTLINSGNNNILGDAVSPANASFFSNCLTKVELGKDVILGQNAMNVVLFLRTIAISKNATIIGGCFGYNYYLEALHLTAVPNNVGGFKGCKVFTFSKSSSCPLGLCNGDTRLRHICLPDNWTSIVTNALRGVKSLTYIRMPRAMKSIGMYSCSDNSQCLQVVDCRYCTQVPTLGDVNKSLTMRDDGKIIVPDALYEEWVDATNWSALPYQIIKASDYTE